VLNVVLLAVAGLASAYWRSPFPLVVGAALAVSLWLGRIHAQPLIGLTAHQVAQARKAEGLGWLLAIIFSVAQ
jgi:hypothetical protein